MLVSLLLLSGCQSLFFWPTQGLVNSPQEFSFEREIVLIENTEGLKLHGWYLNARPSDSKHNGTIYILHGNASNLSYHIANFYWLIDHGWNVFMLDYQGFGRSEGEPTFAGIIDDALLGYNWLRDKHGENETIVVFGQSLGGAAAIGFASKANQAPDGLIVDSTFSSHRQIFRETLAKSWLFWSFQWPLSLPINDDYAPKKLIQQSQKIPTLIIHSQADSLISLEHANTLYESATAPKMLWIDDKSEHAQIWRSSTWKDRLVCQLKRWPELRDPEKVCDSSRKNEVVFANSYL
ncbi:alpha/beta hydrolase [Alteromonas sp. ASW11-19]|uniref:Alpha/beta hydrolase n=1 Tax=Alteromonas salexigens TaxID=2982530 RepID=A0ABT2VPC1_9ALTE|nr:alpha/beta hydrolase [Alteromonas salexigens]